MAEKEHWVLDKRVPVALIIAMVGQFILLLVTGSVIVAKFDSRVAFLEESRKSDSLVIAEVIKAQNTTNISLAEIKKDQNYTVDALRDIKTKLDRK